jgi:hypothetical protein
MNKCMYIYLETMITHCKYIYIYVDIYKREYSETLGTSLESLLALFQYILFDLCCCFMKFFVKFGFVFLCDGRF